MLHLQAKQSANEQLRGMGRGSLAQTIHRAKTNKHALQQMGIVIHSTDKPLSQRQARCAAQQSIPLGMGAVGILLHLRHSSQLGHSLERQRRQTSKHALQGKAG